MRIGLSLLATLSVVVFSACDGGGSDASASSEAESTPVREVSKNAPAEISKEGFNAVYVDASTVQGIEYRCDGQSEVTASGGILTCKALPVSFYLGKVKLGEIKSLKSDYTIFSQDILGIARGATSHPLVTKLSYILQALDDDHNVDNGIVITSEQLENINAHFSESKAFKDVDDEEVFAFIDNIDSKRAVSSLEKEDIQDKLTSAITKVYTPTQPEKEL